MEYPTILKKEQWPREYPGHTAKISEMFLRQIDAADLLNTKLSSVHYQGSWMRVSTWFPWMLMGEMPGETVFRTHGVKLKNGVDDLPKQLRDKIEKEAPDYLHAPPKSSWGKPNESSFTNYLRDRKPVTVKK